MKKVIALVSLCLSFGFALALANTEDTSLNHESPMDSTNSMEDTHQRAGMVGDTQNPNSNVQGDSHTVMDSKTSRSCVDEKGTSLKWGQPGFKECIQAEKNKHPDQMSGTVETEHEIDRVKDTYKATPSPKPTHKE
jgi:hypothetical protein